MPTDSAPQPSGINVIIDDAGVQAQLTLSAEQLEVLSDALEISQPHLPSELHTTLLGLHQQLLSAQHMIAAETEI